MAKGTLKVKILGDADHLEKTLKGAGIHVGGFGKLALGAAAGLGALAVGFAAGLSPAMKLQSAMEKTKIVFGDSTVAVNKWATENARAMGMGATAVAGLAANMGDLLIPMGFTRDTAADMSTKMTGLAGALSSWTGGTKSAAEVAVVLQKSLLGNRDGLSELGIKIMDADVKQRMLANGTEGLTGKLREQAVAQATMELIFEKSTDAQNAFTDSTQTAYEKQLKLKGMYEEVKEKVLTALLPAYDKILSWSLDNWPTIQSAIDTAFRVAGDAMNWIKDDVIPLLVEAFRKIRTWVDDNKEEIKAFFSQVKETASTMYEFIVGTLVPVVIEKLTKLYSDSKEPMANMKQMFDTIVSAVGKVVAALGGGSEFAGLGKLVSIAVDGILMPLRTLITVANAVATAFNLAVSAIERLNRTGVNKTPGPSGTGLGGARGPAPKKQLQGFARGGMVPGTGPQLAVVHGGERVLTPQQQRTWNMGGITIYIQGGPTAEVTADRVVSRIAALGIV